MRGKYPDKLTDEILPAVAYSPSDIMVKERKEGERRREREKRDRREKREIGEEYREERKGVVMKDTKPTSVWRGTKKKKDG